MSDVKSWSLSSLSMYEQCPAKWKFMKIDKIPSKPSYALQRGIAIHSLAEQYLLGNITGMPKELKKFETELKNLKKHKAIPEKSFVCDKNWNLIPKGWMHKDAWLRGKIDAQLGNLVIDFKTGKNYGDKHKDQGELYAIATMMDDDEIDEVDTEFYFLDHGQVAGFSFQRNMLEEYKKKWNARVKKLFNEKYWLPLENQYCNWCEFKDTHCELFKKKSDKTK